MRGIRHDACGSRPRKGVRPPSLRCSTFGLNQDVTSQFTRFHFLKFSFVAACAHDGGSIRPRTVSESCGGRPGELRMRPQAGALHMTHRVRARDPHRSQGSWWPSDRSTRWRECAGAARALSWPRSDATTRPARQRGRPAARLHQAGTRMHVQLCVSFEA